MTPTHVAAVAIALALLAGCGAPLPRAQQAEAEAAVRAAEEIGARENPQAALHLKMARDQLAQAERLIADHDNELARRALERAAADAELALQLARTTTATAEAAAAVHRANELQQEAATH